MNPWLRPLLIKIIHNGCKIPKNLGSWQTGSIKDLWRQPTRFATVLVPSYLFPSGKVTTGSSLFLDIPEVRFPQMTYGNNWNRRPGCLLNLYIFYLEAYFRWALIHFLIKSGKDRKDNLRRLRSDLLNPKFGSQKSALLWIKSHNFSET